MRRLGIYTLLLVMFTFSCKREVNIPIFSYSLLTDDVKNFRLNKTKNESDIIYEYLHQNDTIRNLYLKYNTEKDILISDSDTFHFNNRIYNSKSFKFKYYSRKEIRSHNRFLVFNENYGLMANLAYGADFLFFKDSLSNVDSKNVFKEIFLQLNKINIE